MTPRETTALDRFRKRVESGLETQSAIGRSFGLTPTETSSLIRGLRALKFSIARQKAGPKAKATTKAVIAAKATRKHANGARAH